VGGGGKTIVIGLRRRGKVNGGTDKGVHKVINVRGGYYVMWRQVRSGKSGLENGGLVGRGGKEDGPTTGGVPKNLQSRWRKGK